MTRTKPGVCARSVQVMTARSAPQAAWASPHHPRHGSCVGVLAGGMTFLTLRRAIDRLEKPTERALALGYAATFFGVLLAT
jgi:hypothetical protein